MNARRGFTLIEVLLTCAIFGAVLAMSMSAFMGVNKTNGIAMGSAALKLASNTALKRMYLDLTQCRGLLASVQGATGTDIGQQYFTLFDIPSTLPFQPAPGMTVFPKIRPNGGLGLPGQLGAVGAGELDPATIGNTLVFVKVARTIQVATTGVVILVNGVPQTLASAPYDLPIYHFVAYYLAAPTLPAGYPPFNGKALPFNTTPVGYSYQLANWESKSYIDLTEFKALTAKVQLPGGATGTPAASLVWQDIRAQNPDVVELWDSASGTAATSLYTVDATGTPVSDTNPKFLKGRLGWAVPVGSVGTVAHTMVAFNTGPSFAVPGDVVDSNTSTTVAALPVPAYADAANANAATPPTPYGFEVGIVGPNAARSVLLRLSLAARLSDGKSLLGYAGQQVVRVYDNQ